MNETELQVCENKISLGKKKQQKSINGKKEHENVDVLEQWKMADGIFFGFDNRRSDNELESTVLGHRKKKKHKTFHT